MNRNRIAIRNFSIAESNENLIESEIRIATAHKTNAVLKWQFKCHSCCVQWFNQLFICDSQYFSMSFINILNKYVFTNSLYLAAATIRHYSLILVCNSFPLQISKWEQRSTEPYKRSANEYNE